MYVDSRVNSKWGLRLKWKGNSKQGVLSGSPTPAIN